MILMNAQKRERIRDAVIFSGMAVNIVVILLIIFYIL